MIKAILPKPSSKEAVIFSDTSVCYGDIEIQYQDAVGIAFHSSHTSGTVSSSRSYVGIRSPFSQINVKIRRHDFLGFGDMHTRYQEIYATATQYIAPVITDKLVKQICGGGSVQIGKLLFDKQGITASGLFGSRRQVRWSSVPETRTLDHSFLTSSVLGTIEISYLYPATGKMVVIGTTSSRIENGCLVPRLIQAMNEWHRSLVIQSPQRSPSSKDADDFIPKQRSTSALKVSPNVHECVVFINSVLSAHAQQRISSFEAPIVVHLTSTLLSKSLGDARVICSLFDQKIRQELRRPNIILEEIIMDWERDHR